MESLSNSILSSLKQSVYLIPAWQKEKTHHVNTQDGQFEKERSYQEKFLNGTAAEFLTDTNEDEGTIFSFHPDLKGLGECCCESSLRSHIPALRNKFENKVVKRLIQFAKENSNIEITFLASGMLFGEFAILVKFLSALRAIGWKGFLFINVIDKRYNGFPKSQTFSKEAIETFQKEILQNLDPKNRLELRVFASTQDYQTFVAVREANRTDFLITIEPASAECAFNSLSRDAVKKCGFSFRFSKQIFNTNSKVYHLIQIIKSCAFQKGDEKVLILDRNKIYVYKDQKVFRKLISLVLNKKASFEKKFSYFKIFNEAVRTNSLDLALVPDPFFRVGQFHQLKFT